MLEQLRLSNHAIIILIAGIVMLSMASDGYCDQNIDDNHKTYHGIEGDHTTDITHGLYEIREEARRFMAKHNSINHTDWVVGDPDLRSLVPKCVVPLKVKWVPKSYGLSNKSVMVYCTKALSGYSRKDQWDVIINVTAPRGSFELLFNVREAAVALLKQTHSKQTAGFFSTDIFVGKCLEPLEATMNKKNSAVNVTCKKPLQTFFFKGDSWTVPVPIQSN
ncbi:MAG: hypothetical protein Q7U91_03085 [Sideroxyarcus sp.]|nr:hypothetical protein [Sideroxyarcus sp.]